MKDKTYLGVLDLGTRSVVGEPKDLTRSRGPNATTRQAQLGLIEDLAEDFLLAFAGSDKRDTVRVVDDRVGERDSLGRRLGAIFEEGDPSVLLAQKVMTGEEGAGVTVGTHAEEDEIKDGVPGGIPLGKRLDELTLVLVGELFWVVEKRGVDGVDLGRCDGGVGEEELIDRGVVGVLVVEGNESLVAEEDFPVEDGRIWEWKDEKDSEKEGREGGGGEGGSGSEIKGAPR